MARSYRQKHCPVARTLDMIGERWTMLILRDLLLHGPRRYQDLQESLAGVAPIPWRLSSAADLDNATPLPGTAYKVDIARTLVSRALRQLDAP